MSGVITTRRSLYEPVALSLTDEEVGDLTESRVDRVRAAAERLVDAAVVELRLPLLPETVSEALALANDPSTPMNRLERVVARDAVLASRMLMVASSAAYGGHSSRTLSGALQRMGSGTVRDVLYQAVMQCHIFRGENEGWARRERDHALAVGNIAKSICKLVGLDGDLVFVCGLLHDLGRVALHAPQAPASAAAPALEASLQRDAEQIAHTRLGARIAAIWNLPSLVCEALRRHHRYRGFGPRNDGYSQIGHIIAAADVVAGHLGIGRAPHALDDVCLEIICSLGLDPQAIVAMARVEQVGPH
jgi:putative nucleotidyltransferase with HDIG domain